MINKEGFGVYSKPISTEKKKGKKKEKVKEIIITIKLFLTSQLSMFCICRVGAVCGHAGNLEEVPRGRNDIRESIPYPASLLKTIH